MPLEEEIVTSFDHVLRLLVYLSLRNKDKCFDTRALVTTINQLLLILVSKCVTARQINLKVAQNDKILEDEKPR